MPANRLQFEKSPYLLQHAHNPVDWRPWGQAAFDEARARDKPIFLSIGYSTCHWCHVMERESFESEEIAALLNRSFVPIKVDREERPDVDRVYMAFVQASTGSGGWPMSVWLTPDLEPFFGGTYFPPDDRYGRPGFLAVLAHLDRAWTTERERVRQSATEVMAQLRRHAERESRPALLDDSGLESCFYTLRRGFDSRLGGFGDAPKFPRPVVFNFLFRFWERTATREALDMALFTLRAMAAGGMNDQLGGGFHRYSVDERWHVPHFEKMLYDQAQLAVSYLEAHQIARDDAWARIAGDVFRYVLRDLTHADGGFFSAEDADSVIDPSRPHEKGEGAFYVWSWADLEQVLGTAAAGQFAAVYGVERIGNVRQDPHQEFTGMNILFEARAPGAEEAAALAESRRKLLDARASRVRPHLDDKILAGWNGLMISALAKGAQILKEPRYAEAAGRAADFILARLYDRPARSLLRRFRDGEAAIGAFLDDYACLIHALVDLYETSFELERLTVATELAERMIERFEDREAGAFFSSAAGTADLVIRMKDDYDGAEPSGNSMAALALLRLADLTGRRDFAEAAERTLTAFAQRMMAAPIGVPQMLVAHMRARAPRRQVVIAGARGSPEVRALLDVVRRRFLPNTTVMLIDSDDDRRFFAAGHPEIASMTPLDGRAAAYVCENFACRLPVSDPPALEKQLE